MTNEDFTKLARLLYEMEIKESDVENIHRLINDIVKGVYDPTETFPF